MEPYSHSLLIYEDTEHVSGMHRDFYVNFCMFHQSEEVISNETFSNRITLLLKEKYNATIREEYIGFFDIGFFVKAYLEFDSEADKLEFLLTWS